jgi:hypothetical protein
VASEVSAEDHDAGEFEKPAVAVDTSFVTDQKSAPVAKPREEPFDLLAFAVSAECPPILQRWTFAIAPVRAGQFAVKMAHQLPEVICIIGAVDNHTPRDTTGPLPAIGERRDHQIDSAGDAELRFRGE